MDGDSDPDLSRHPEHPQEIEEQERRRLLEAKKKAKKKARKKRRGEAPARRREDPSELQEDPSELQKEQVSRRRRDEILARRGQEDHDPVRHPEPPAFQPEAPLCHPDYIKQHERHRPVAEKVKKAAKKSLARRRHSQPSSPRQTGLRVPAGAGTTTRVRQSVLYSDRPRRSRGRRGRAPVEEHSGELSSSKGPTVRDLSEFKALVLNDTPPKLELTDSSRSNECAYDTANSGTDSEIIEEEKPRDEPDYDLSEILRKVKQLPTCGGFMEDYIARGYCDPPQHRLESPTENLAQCKVSTKEIIENGKEWMGEEVMLAFEKHIEGKDRFKDMVYCLDELQHQCFSVETYHKMFHHYNFTVKTKKKNSDDDWSSTLYFAQVTEIYGRKYYYCSQLYQYDDGCCYTCKNQGMDALRHPMCLLGVETGNVNTGCPFIYLSDDDSDFEL